MTLKILNLLVSIDIVATDLTLATPTLTTPLSWESAPIDGGRLSKMPTRRTPRDLRA